MQVKAAAATAAGDGADGGSLAALKSTVADGYGAVLKLADQAYPPILDYWPALVGKLNPVTCAPAPHFRDASVSVFHCRLDPKEHTSSVSLKLVSSGRVLCNSERSGG